MFLLISIAMMWLMIFGVGCFYFGMLPKSDTNHILSVVSVSLFSATIAFLFIGYPIAFSTPSLLFTENMDTSTLLNLLFQLCFCLYAVVMVIGSVVNRLKLTHAIIISMLWVIAVYTPLVHLFWSENAFFAQLGALDFSGGIVVHLSAGVSSYVLAYFFKQAEKVDAPVQNPWLYLGMIFITLGWFFFNAGPVGELNDQSALIIVKTLVALITGGGVWAVSQYTCDKKVDTETILNGTIVGLVTSTSSVGFVSLFELLCIVGIASALTYFCIRYVLTLIHINDVVDSFGMNGIGGLFGSLGTILFRWNAFIGQISGIVFTIMLSFVFTALLSILLKKSKRFL
ncbi:ammonium transporter [Carnobacteriaceae bacterium zg-ZUI252]|nr:ammonium transporter [Carnobacteriaceae bacterium zg-ZUI252]